jgi:hypothetical protein
MPCSIGAAQGIIWAVIGREDPSLRTPSRRVVDRRHGGMMGLFALFLVTLLIALSAQSASEDRAALPHCVSDQNGERNICSRNDTYCGEWQGREWHPTGCRYRDISSEQARTCVGNRTLAFIGDSMIRNLGMGVAFFLSGQTVDSESETSVDERLKNGTRWLNATYLPEENLYLFPNPANKATHNWDWQVQLWYLATNGGIREGGVERVLTNKASKEMKEILANKGVRGVQEVQGVQGVQAQNDVHVRPLDFAFWCHGINDWGWFDNRPFGPKFFEQFTAHWVRIREEMAVPSVWVSMNNNCKERYSPDGLYMGSWVDDEKREKGFHMIEDANRYVHKTLRQKSLPYFDAAAVLRSPQRCAASYDGLHVRMWVNIVRAKILFNHLCSDENEWVGTVTRF